MDQSHILLNFRHEPDYVRCFYRRSWNISGYHMRVTKWTVDFDPSMDAPIVPLWVALPGLPIYLYHKAVLFEIVRPIGMPIKLDTTTSDGLRPSVARVCVEVDVSQDLHKKTYLHAKQQMILQQVVYEDLPQFCVTCRRLGHATGACEQPAPPPVAPPLVAPSRPATRWTPKKKPPTQSNILDAPVILSRPSDASEDPLLAPNDVQDISRLGLDAKYPPQQEAEDMGDFGHSSDTELHVEDLLPNLPSVSDEIIRMIRSMPESPSEDILISRLMDPAPDEGFITIVPRRRQRTRKKLPSLPPSTILARSAARSSHRSEVSLSQ